MLKELFDLSQNVDIVLPPVGYSSIVAHIAIEVDSIVSISSLEHIDVKGKQNLGQEILLPDFVRSSGNRPLPVADTASYILGLGKKGKIRKVMYLELLEECLNYQQTQDTAIARVIEVVKSLEIVDVRQKCSPWFDLDPQKSAIEPLEKARIVFLYQGQRITDRDSVKKFWAKKYAELSNVTDQGECAITGEQKPLVAGTLPVMVKGVPGSQSKGAALISFNFKSLESRRWERSEHSPISFEVAERSHQMLNKLLREERHHYKQGKVAFVYWGEYETGLNPAIWDDPEELWEDDTSKVVQMIFTSAEDPKKFNRAASCSSTQFYLAVLTGCDGRVAISRWEETTPEKISGNITQYIQAQKSIPGYKARPIWQLVNSCFRNPNKEHTDPVIKALVLNALGNNPIPRSIVVKVLERICLDLFTKGKDQKYYSRYFSRFQVLALYLNSMNNQQSPEMVRRLKIAQQLGAVAYLIHDAEMTARNLDDAGKTGVASSLRALSTTPKEVFGRLYQNAILYHIPSRCNDGEPKKKESRRRHLKRVGKLLKEEFSKLVEMKLTPETDLPTTFSLDENAWFHLGWAMREATFWDGVEKQFSDKNNESNNSAGE